MDESTASGSRAKVQHLKKFVSKHSSQLSLDSPLYDASEEDNTDDGSSMRVNQPWTRPAGQAPTTNSSIIQGGKTPAGARAGTKASSKLAHVSDLDSGVDSPTYDGDVEMNTAVPSSKHSTATLSPLSVRGGAPLPPNSTTPISSLNGGDAGPAKQLQDKVVASLGSLSGPTITTPSSPVSSLYPDPPSSAASTNTGTDDEKENSSAPESKSRKGSNSAATPFIKPAVLIAPPSSSNVPTMTPKAATEQLLPDSAPPDATTMLEHSDGEADGAFVNPSVLSAEDIRTFVQRAIDGEEERTYKINTPPLDRPIRVYADGVYDMFHFGHALQLRQAKLSFPSVHLLVGIPSDALCKTHKARTVLSHFERVESVRHCRWTDEVIPDAPWIIDPEFIERHGIDYVAHDEEPYADSSGSGDIYGPIKDLGKFLPTRRTPGISTSQLLERLVSRYRLGDFDGKLEKIGHGELSARGSVYDDSRPGSRMSSRPPAMGGGGALLGLPTSLPVHLPNGSGPGSPESENGK